MGVSRNQWGFHGRTGGWNGGFAEDGATAMGVSRARGVVRVLSEAAIRRRGTRNGAACCWTGDMMMTTRQLCDQGLTASGIRQRLAAGELRRLRRGVYEVGVTAAQPTPEEQHLRLVEGVMLQRPGAILSHVSAAVAHGLPMPTTVLGRVHLIQPCRRFGSKRTDSLYLHRTPEEIEVAGVEGLSVTSLERTVLDVIRVLQPHHGVAVVDRALRLGVPREMLLGLLREQSGWRGNKRAREVIHFGDPLAESPGESWTRWQLVRAGLPLPELQREFFDPRTGQLVARTDFYWRSEQLVGEFDGEVKYGRLLGPGQTVSDVVMAEKRREEELRRLGVWVVRFRTADLWNPQLLRQIVQDGFAFARPA